MPYSIATKSTMEAWMIPTISLGIPCDCIIGWAAFSMPNKRPAKRIPPPELAPTRGDGDAVHSVAFNRGEGPSEIEGTGRDDRAARPAKAPAIIIERTMFRFTLMPAYRAASLLVADGAERESEGRLVDDEGEEDEGQDDGDETQLRREPLVIPSRKESLSSAVSGKNAVLTLSCEPKMLRIVKLLRCSAT